MTTINYELIGEYGTPEKFMNGVHEALLARKKKIRLVAKRINVDDLAARRGQIDTRVTFDLDIDIIDQTAGSPSVSGYMYVDGDRQAWILIQTDEEESNVRFDIYS